ncbi:hypothetical protein [Flagellimonas amoyensis]|uniref:hypothetical protein n=1 Tax=Flagellimonas amoyensis TaxID=2169401 RepID=UPI00131F0675|nr:hypothetical protein [Allomuricauda amoyensis]
MALELGDLKRGDYFYFSDQPRRLVYRFEYRGYDDVMDDWYCVYSYNGKFYRTPWHWLYVERA